ncbi:MAG: PD-(D/E)XK nuclease family protein [Solirubrobacterales bacterium]|nr:PD-(D/E)XK nuclease family protein [Solirubrobacterales bacterium]
MAAALLAENRTFSATALEAFAACPYGWFIERALNPMRFGPEPEPMARGNLVHKVLARIYGDRIGRIPRHGKDLEKWLEAVEPAVNELAADDDIGLGSDSAAHRVLRRQAVNAISGYLRSEADRESPGFMPDATEADFGIKNGEPQDMGGWNLRGSIDRIDVSGEKGVGAGQRGIVLDYKTGSGVFSRVEIARHRKLQLQLYLHVLDERFEIKPVAGLYVPVSRSGGKARGIVDRDSASDVADLNPNRYDKEKELSIEIEAAVAEANQIVQKILKGKIDHNPLDCTKHFSHAAVPDPELRQEAS